jgi:hypothetical protein
MGLRHLPAETHHDGGWVTQAFNNTWGHLSPQKNCSYKGVVRFCLTDHSQYGCQPIVLQYEFPNLEGPYLHDFLFDKICDLDTRQLPKGAIYQINLTFRNYRFYYGKIQKICEEIKI